MLVDDLFKSNWESIDIHFSSDRRLDEAEIIKLNHLRSVKTLRLHQDGSATKFYHMFKNIKLDRLHVTQLIIHSKNFQKTKTLLHALRNARVNILEIIFEEGTCPESILLPFVNNNIVLSAHVILTNIKEKDIHDIKWLLRKLEGHVSSIWLQQVNKDVKRLSLLGHIDNLHVCMGFPFDILDQINVTNLHIHGKSLDDIRVFDESMLLPMKVAKEKGHNLPMEYKNLIVEITSPSPTYLIKVFGRGYDLHINREVYSTHKHSINMKSIVQHKKIPPNWASLYWPVS